MHHTLGTRRVQLVREEGRDAFESSYTLSLYRAFMFTIA